MTRLTLFALLISAAPAFAQGAMPPPMIPSSGATSLSTDEESAALDPEIEAAVDEALAAAALALADSTSPEDMMAMLPEMEQVMEEMAGELEVALTEMGASMATMLAEMAALDPELAAMAAAGAPEASGARGPRLVGVGRPSRANAPQQYNPVSGVYGADDDGFPSQTTIRGIVESAGSQRLCRAGRPAVSRWLKVRLTDTPREYPPVYMVVAVECDELDARHYVGKRVSMTAWKSIPSRPVRMARNDVPEVDGPMYQTYPGNVRIGG